MTKSTVVNNFILKHAPTRTKREMISDLVENLRKFEGTAQIKQAIMSTPMKYRLRYARVLSKLTGITLAARMKCYECCGFEDATNRIDKCTVYACPLWNHRKRVK
jgi:hypothetical protein